MHVVRIALLAGLASVWVVPYMLSGGNGKGTVIPAGNSATIGSKTPPAEDTPQAQILTKALSQETRDTLQQAMNSAGQ